MGHHPLTKARLGTTMKAQMQRMAIDHLWIITFVIIAIFSLIVTFA